LGGTRLPEPENGMVVRFNYRWSDPQQAVKERPACIAFVRAVRDPRHSEEGAADAVLKEVVYLPITSKEPRPPTMGHRIPDTVCRALHIEGRRSWVIVSECNVQYWPNDLARVSRPGSEWVYGFVPPRFFRTISEAFKAEIKRRRATVQEVHYLPGRR
jgi:hypothetical protein